MAERRMFSLQIVDSDAFLDMPQESQNLYFHLGMRADDNGFIANPKKILRMISCSEDSFSLLLVKRFLLSFPSGVIVIKHWGINNKLRGDRIKETVYSEELKMLKTKENNAYTFKAGFPLLQPDVNQMSTRCPLRVVEDRVVEDRKDLPEKQEVKFTQKKDKKQRTTDFIQKLNGFKETYSKDLLNNFYLYWTESGDNDKKLRFEKEKSFSIERRLVTWKNREGKFDNKQTRSKNRDIRSQYSQYNKTAKYEHEKVAGFQPISDEDMALIDNFPDIER